MHQYRVTCAWSGSTGRGYDEYSRDHRAAAPPAEASLTVSADPAFRGDPARLNPEQLLVMAAASCQLLSFLAVAARARLDVVAYADDAEGEMPEDDPPMRVTRIVLRPRITVRAATRDPRATGATSGTAGTGATSGTSDTAGATSGTSETDVLVARVRHCCEVAHRECYIANSLTTTIVVDPSVTVLPD